MRRSMLLSAVLIGTSALTLASAASAQTQPAGLSASSLGVSIGAATNGEATRRSLGASAGWSLGSWLGAEARMTWFDTDAGDDAMSATLNARFQGWRVGASAPFVRAGLGLHVASFGAQRASAPDFFRRRFGANEVYKTFRDPAVVVGAGIDLHASQRLILRPEIESMLVWHDGRHYVVTSVSMQVLVRFERQPITPGQPLIAR